MVYEFKSNRRVEFSDTDMAGIMHFSRYFVFMESVEHAFFRSLGYSITTRADGKDYGWPRVDVQCKFKQPLRFEDEVELHLVIREIKSKVITYDIIFRKLNGDTVQEVARGSLSVICVTMDWKEKQMKATNIPAEIADKIEPAPPGFNL